MPTPSRKPKKLNPQKGQNEADCLITSVCMCIDMPVFQAKALLGHDGTEKLWPSLQPPQCYRGFSYPECIMLAYLKGMSAVYHEFNGLYCPYPGITPKPLNLPDVYRDHILAHSVGVITMEQGNAFHSVAFCDSIIYDPRGDIYMLPKAQYKHIQSCITFEPRVTTWITQHDINTLMTIGARNG